MRFSKTLMYALFITSALSVTSSYGSSPPGNVSKINKVYIEPTISAGLAIETPAVSICVHDLVVFMEMRIASFPGLTASVQTESIPAATYGYAIDRRVVSSSIFNHKMTSFSNLHYQHIDPGLKLISATII